MGRHKVSPERIVSQSVHRAALIALLCASFLADSPPTFGQQPVPPLEIELGRATRTDSRLEFLAPAPDETGMRMEFLEEGIKFIQSNKNLKQPTPMGFILQAGSRTDFAFMLEFDCLKLAPSLYGWGQGLLIRFVSQNPADPDIAVGYVATRQAKSGLAVWMNGESVPDGQFQLLPMDLNRGTWLILREGDQLVVSISESGGSFRKAASQRCGTAAIKEIHVLGT